MIHWGVICYLAAETQSSLELKISSESLSFLREENGAPPDHLDAILWISCHPWHWEIPRTNLFTTILQAAKSTWLSMPLRSSFHRSLVVLAHN